MARQTAVEDPALGATLEGVLRDLVGVVEVAGAPAGLGMAVGDAVLATPDEEPDFDAGDVLLAVGLDGRGLQRLLAVAGDGGAAAVVVKADAVDDALLGSADAARVALLHMPVTMRWGQLHTLLRTALIGAHAQVDSRPTLPLGDLFGLANAVASMVGGPATIEDPKSRVLAYSSLTGEIDPPRRETILGRRVPPEWLEKLQERGIFRQLWSTHDVVLIPEDDEIRARIAIAVRAGDEILGSIWVAEDQEPFGDRAMDALREAGQIAALHLVRAKLGDDLQRGVRGELLRAALDGGGATNVLAEELRLGSTDPWVVMAFQLESEEDAEIAIQRERAADLIALHLEAFRRRAISVPVGSVVYTLLPVADAVTPDHLRKLARDVIGRAETTLRTRMRVAVSAVSTDMRDLPGVRRDADQVLRVLAQEEAGTVATLDDVRAAVSLLDLKDLIASQRDLFGGPLVTLLEHDAENNTEYAVTLDAYLRWFGDTPSAAAELDVHANTFRYRLRRLQEISGIDLSNPDERLVAQLHLRIGR